MLLIESFLLIIALTLSLTGPRRCVSWLGKIEQGFTSLARRRTPSVITVGLVTIALRAVLLPVLPIPEPVIHDEFGYLLASETFTHGRLTNPTHPMWVHFETFSIIQKPTYQCFAQPAQGMFLALGRILFGHSFFGVMLSAGLMCAATCWMLQGWMPARWALVGGFLSILRYGVTSYWGNSYWGGAMGAIGGALLLGALPRIKRSQKIKDARLMASGIAILANSRPFEGAVLCLPVAAALFVWMLGRRGPGIAISLRRIVLPIGALLALVALGMGYYNWRVTGHAFQMAYQAERQQYGIAPYLLWQRPTPGHVYYSDSLRQLYAHEEILAYGFFSSWQGLVAKFWWGWRFFLGPALTLPIVMMAVALPPGFSWRQVDRGTRFLLATLGICLGGTAAETFWAPHYSSPFSCLLLALVMLAIRQLARWRCFGRPGGLLLTGAIPLICFVLFAFRAFAGPLPDDEFQAEGWYQRGPLSFGRAAILDKLQQLDGRQLVMVRYKLGRSSFHEWVYNDANIDASKVVWAREISPEEDRKLLDYFKDRRVWLLEADENPVRLTEYPVGRLSSDR